MLTISAGGSRSSTRTTTARAGRQIRALTWDYPTDGAHGEPDLEAVVCRRSTATPSPMARLVQSFQRRCRTTARPPAAAGSTPASCRSEGTTARANRQRRRQGGARLGLRLAANRRILYNRASADPTGQPWSERKKWVWWDADAGAVDRPRRAGLSPRPSRPTTSRPPAPAGSTPTPATRRSSCIGRRQGRLFAAAGLRDGPLPTHYEPWESPVGNPLYPEQPRNPVAQTFDAARQPLPRARRSALPLRHHHLPPDRAPHGRRDEPLGALAGRAAAGGLRRDRARSWPPSRASTTATG